MRRIIRNAWICTIDEQDNIKPQFGDLEFDDSGIIEITSRTPDHFSPASGNNEIDAEGRMLTAPAVNFHEHIYSRLAKGLPVSGPMNNFVEILENLWWKLDRTLDIDMVRASAQMAAIESLQNGVTYLFDHHASPTAAKGSLSAIAEILQEFGLRSVLAFEISDRNGKEIARQSLRENVDFIRHGTNEDVKGMMGLHALFTISDETLNAIAREMAELNTGIHIHVAEDKADVQVNRQKYGRSIAERLQQYHLLNNRSLLIHGVHLQEQDYAIIDESGAALVYNPDSNLNNAVGLPDYAAVPMNIPLLTGTDGMHANVGRSLKQIFLLYRHQGNSFEDTFAFVQKIFKNQLQFVRRYFPDFTHLQPKDRADLVLWDYRPPTPVTNENFFGHYIYGLLESAACTVFQNGMPLMLDKQIRMDELSTAQNNIRNQGKRLFELFAKS